MDVTYLIQLVRNHNPPVLNNANQYFQKIHTHLSMADLSTEVALEKAHFTEAVVYTLEYGVAFNRVFIGGSPNAGVFHISRSAQYLALSEALFDLLRLHRENKKEMLDFQFSKLINTFLAFAELKGYDLKKGVESVLGVNSQRLSQ